MTKIKVLCSVVLVCLTFSFVYYKAKQDYERCENNSQIATYINQTSMINKSNFDTNEDSHNNQEYDFILEISKLNLKQGVYQYTSQYNNIDKAVTLLYPDGLNKNINSSILLAAHSGNSNISYFHNLDLLEVDDLISIYYHGKKINYKVISKEIILKEGNIPIENSNNLLYLTTCDENDSTMQMVIKSIEISSEVY